jgi:hypothetical protein
VAEADEEEVDDDPWSEKTQWETQEPWLELTPTNPHASAAPAADPPADPAAPGRARALELLAPRPDEPPGLEGETSTTFEEDSDAVEEEVTNRFLLSSVLDEADAELEEGATPAPVADQVTRKVDIATVMSEELDRHRRRR